MMKKLLLILCLSAFASLAAAKDIEFTDIISQEDFKDFVKEFGASLLFNPMAPAETLGMTGFDVSLEVVTTDISDGKRYWEILVDDNDPFSQLPVPRLHVQKGLPFGIDVGAMYVNVPDTNIDLWGIEAKYALLEGGILTPALSIRGSYSQLSGVDDIDLNTQSLDLLISKGFLMLTPYAGASIIRVRGTENTSLVELDEVNETDYRGIAGVQFSPFPLLVINGEVTFLGEVRQYGLKIGLRF